MVYEKTNVYLDAGYLSEISKHFGEGKYIKIDLIKFSKYLAIKQGLWWNHTYYYTAPPFQSDPPSINEIKKKKAYDSFISKMNRIEGITVREGRLQKN